MRSLLYVSFLIALLDPDHDFHNRAHDWWQAHRGERWASCPLLLLFGVFAVVSTIVVAVLEPDTLFSVVRTNPGLRLIVRNNTQSGTNISPVR